MRRICNGLLCLILCMGLLLTPFAALAEAAATQAPDAQQGDDAEMPEQNETIQFEEKRALSVAVCNVMDGYGIGLHVRTDAFKPSTVIISGNLYAEEGMELVSVIAGLDNGSLFKGESLLRYGCPAGADSPDSLEGTIVSQLGNEMLDIDYSRAGFAFLVDLSGAGLTPGSHQVNVSLMLSTASRPNMACAPLTTTVTVAENGAFVPDLMYYLSGVPRFVIRNGDSGEKVSILQTNLITLKYLDEGARTNVYDEATQTAVRELCAANGQDFSTEGVTASLDAFISSGCAIGKETVPEDVLGKVLYFMNSKLPLGALELPWWVVIASVAGLLVIVLVVILIVKASSRRRGGAEIPADASFEQGIKTSQDDVPGPEVKAEQPEVSRIVSTGDEETVDLNNSQNGFVIAEDEPTLDMREVQCHFRIRMCYREKIKEMEQAFSSSKQMIIGVGDAADIRTNPEDKKVSRMHGVFEIKDGTPYYTDRSKNGTRVNGAAMLHNDSVELRVGVMYQLDMGEHIVQFKIDSLDP